MTGNSKLDLLVGRYFLAPFPHDEQGIVEAVIDDGHCLVRFEADGNRPEALAVVALSDMVRAGNTGNEDEVPNWVFFDSLEERARYRAWINNPEEPNKPRVVLLRRKDTE
jgi:hypothetical protein